MTFSRAYQQLKNIYHFFQAWFWRLVYGRPDASLKIYGVTGTNGKTTTCIVLGNILRAAHGGERVGLLTTIVFWVGAEEVVNESKMTTLDSRDVFRNLKTMKQKGVTHMVLEMTSHALDQHRLWGIQLEGAIITNIAREHLDYHHTMEEYAAAKAKIVKYIKPNGVLVGKDDDVFVKKILDSVQGVRILRFTTEEAKSVETPLIGDVNKENVLGASKLLTALGVSEEAISRGVAGVTHVPGRMEWVVIKPQTPMTNDQKQPARVLIDYAVTSDALERLYRYARTQTDGKIYGVLGAAGLRDRGKRAEMARVVARYTDELVITREDPWTESEEQIFRDLEAGLTEKSSWQRITDRKEALKYVLGKAQAGDIVVVTGKGAERGMGIGKEVIPWHEQTIIEDLLREL